MNLKGKHMYPYKRDEKQLWGQICNGGDMMVQNHENKLEEGRLQVAAVRMVEGQDLDS